jgi:hypothetical protein
MAHPANALGTQFHYAVLLVGGQAELLAIRPLGQCPRKSAGGTKDRRTPMPPNSLGATMNIPKRQAGVPKGQADGAGCCSLTLMRPHRKHVDRLLGLVDWNSQPVTTTKPAIAGPLQLTTNPVNMELPL